MKKILIVLFGLLPFFVYGATVDVNLSSTYQTMEGFGGGIVYYQSWLTAHDNQQDIYDTIFTGLNPQFIRMGNWNQDTTATLKQDSIIVYNARQRLGNNVEILMSSWSAPGYLKASGDIKGNDENGNLRSKSENTLKKINGKYVYEQFAHWWKISLKKYAKKGIIPSIISIQNEPDMNASYEETLFDATENSTVAGYSEALNAVSDSINTLSNPPKIAAPEVLGIGYGNFDKYASKLDVSKFDYYNYHLYHGGNYSSPDDFASNMNVIRDNYSSKPNIMTEYCAMRETKETDMVSTAQIIVNALTEANASGYIDWEMIWGGTDGQMVAVENPWESDSWTSSKGFIIKPEYHTIRHFSKYIRRGWKRIGTTSSNSNLYTVAFTSSAGDSVTVVAVNIGNSNIDETINIDGSFNAITYCQSVENGDKSILKDLSSPQTNFTFPARSISTIVYASPTGVKNKNSNLVISKILTVYPDPAVKNIYVNTILNGKIILYDCNQKKIQILKKGYNNISSLSQGIYTVNVENGNKILQSKRIYKTK